MKHITVKKPKDLMAGLLFLAAGAGVGVISSDYDMGTIWQMGPGYFPTLLGLLLSVLALIQIVGSLVGHAEPRQPPSWTHLRPMVLVLLGATLFGLLVKPAGLPIAIVAMLLVGIPAMSDYGRWPAAATIAVIAGGSVLVFVYLLRLPIPVIGSLFGY